MRTPLLALALAALSLSACNDSDDSGSSGTPDCSDVWVAGETLPEEYEGCKDGGSTELAVVLTYGECEISSYDDRFYAVLGEEIAEVDGEMSEDEGYAALIDECNDGSDSEDESDSEEEPDGASDEPTEKTRPDGAVGDPLEVGDWTVTVTDIQRNAGALVQRANQFNDPARESYVLVTYEATYHGTERKAGAAWDLTWTFTTSDQQVHDTASQVTPADNEEWPTEVRSGGTVRAQVLFDLDDELFHGGVLMVEGMTADYETVYAEMWL